MTDLHAIVQAASFVPSNRQIRARSEFHTRNPSGSFSPEVTAPEVQALGGPAAIIKWWGTPGFSDWFLAPSWEQEESHRLLMQSMQRVSEILRDSEDEKNVISAAREAREIYTKLNASVAQKFADEEVAEMTRDQLQEYIRRKTAAVK